MIEYEIEKATSKGITYKDIYLAGFSQGAQLTSYVQLAVLKQALGGVIVMDGYPLPPLVDMVGKKDAKKNATYTGDDMSFMIWEGADDQIFPASQTMKEYYGIFDALGIDKAWKIYNVEKGMGHTVTEKEFTQMVEFVTNGKPGPSPKPPTPKPPAGNVTHYTVAGMDVEAFTLDGNKTYDKVVIELHGGGGDNQMWYWDWT